MSLRGSSNRNIHTFVLLSCGNKKEHFTKPLGDSTATDEPRGFFIMQSKVCNTCKKELSISSFGIQKGRYLNHQCKKCHTSNTQSNQRSLIGFIGRIYSRQKACSTRRGYLPPSYSLLELKEYLLSRPIYERLHAEWVESGYKRDKSPSCDRLDDYKGYSFDNIRVTTWEENRKKGSKDRLNGINNKGSKAVSQYSLDGIFIQEFHSQIEAYRKTGVFDTSISKCVKGRVKTAGGFIWKNTSVKNSNSLSST